MMSQRLLNFNAGYWTTNVIVNSQTTETESFSMTIYMKRTTVLKFLRNFHCNILVPNCHFKKLNSKTFQRTDPYHLNFNSMKHQLMVKHTISRYQCKPSAWTEANLGHPKSHLFRKLAVAQRSKAGQGVSEYLLSFEGHTSLLKRVKYQATWFYERYMRYDIKRIIMQLSNSVKLLHDLT